MSNTTTIALANLDALSFDQLGVLYGILDARASARSSKQPMKEKHP